MSNNTVAATKAKLYCKQYTEERQMCYDFNGGKDTEECFIEELNEKRCLAFACCYKEAQVFYGQQKGIKGKGKCALWAEVCRMRAY